MPEWWGLRVQGALVKVIRWRELSAPTLADFDTPLPSGAEFQIAPLHVAAPE